MHLKDKEDFEVDNEEEEEEESESFEVDSDGEESFEVDDDDDDDDQIDDDVFETRSEAEERKRWLIYLAVTSIHFFDLKFQKQLNKTTR